MNHPASHYDVAIVGAGPAGATCALALGGSGLKVALIDKSTFPRDKVCGDAIPARCERVLHSIAPQYAEALRAFSQKVTIASCRVVAPNRRHFDYAFHTSGYCSPRLDFDHFLVELALQEGGLDFFPDARVTTINRIPGEPSGTESAGVWQVGMGERSISASLVVGCDGANGITARELAGTHIDPEHHCAAVRAYYTGISDLDPSRLEIHLLDGWLPGYFWIFPLPGGRANVGFGMLSRRVAEQKLSLRQALPEIVATAPGLAERFAGASLEGPVTGFGLPMGSRKVPLSGAGFLLCGDAASLIEPATGEGIGNAMLSGKLAARRIKEAFEAGDLSAPFLKAYDQAVYGALWRDLRNKYRAQRILGERRRLMNWLVARANSRGPIRWMMKKVF